MTEDRTIMLSGGRVITISGAGVDRMRERLSNRRRAQALAIAYRRSREQRAHTVAVRSELNRRWLLGHRED